MRRPIRVHWKCSLTQAISDCPFQESSRVVAHRHWNAAPFNAELVAQIRAWQLPSICICSLWVSWLNTGDVTRTRAGFFLKPLPHRDDWFLRHSQSHSSREAFYARDASESAQKVVGWSVELKRPAPLPLAAI